MAYREPARRVHARFELRTPPGFVAVRVVLGFVATGVVALLASATVAFGVGSLMTYLVGALVVGAIVAWWIDSAPYRIGGGSAELVVTDDVVEVPGVRRGEVVRLPRKGLVVERRPVRVEVRFAALPLGAVDRGEILVLRSGGVTRRLSTLTAPAPDFADRLLAAILAANGLEDADAVVAQFDDIFRQVFSADGRRAAAAPAQRDELDRRIDEELRLLDD